MTIPLIMPVCSVRIVRIVIRQAVGLLRIADVIQRLPMKVEAESTMAAHPAVNVTRELCILPRALHVTIAIIQAMVAAATINGS